jgi:hypothetical protein
MKQYNVWDNDLFRVFHAIEDHVIASGIHVEIVNLSNATDSWEQDADHAETCTSDGLTIYLHNQLADHGGIATRIYDILHMGCGHLIQWWATETSGLERYGDKAREIGSVFHGDSSEQVLQDVERYEFEAWRLGISYLTKIIDTLALDGDKQDIIQMYSDYVRTDKDYIIDYYRTWKSKNFFASRQCDQPIVDLIPVPIDFTPKQRTTIQLWLVRQD